MTSVRPPMKPEEVAANVEALWQHTRKILAGEIPEDAPFTMPHLSKHEPTQATFDFGDTGRAD